jgi:hypothetical protein
LRRRLRMRRTRWRCEAPPLSLYPSCNTIRTRLTLKLSSGSKACATTARPCAHSRRDCAGVRLLRILSFLSAFRSAQRSAAGGARQQTAAACCAAGEVLVLGCAAWRRIPTPPQLRRRKDRHGHSAPLSQVPLLPALAHQQQQHRTRAARARALAGAAAAAPQRAHQTDV